MNEPLKLPNGVFTLIESAEATSGERVSFEIVLPPGAHGPPPHFHPRQHETLARLTAGRKARRRYERVNADPWSDGPAPAPTNAAFGGGPFGVWPRLSLRCWAALSATGSTSRLGMSHSGPLDCLVRKTLKDERSRQWPT